MLLMGYLLLGETLVGQSGANYVSLIRYLLPVMALVFPVVAELAEGRWRSNALSAASRRRWIVAGLVIASLLAGLQAIYFYRYVLQMWVA